MKIASKSTFLQSILLALLVSVSITTGVSASWPNILLSEPTTIKVRRIRLEQPGGPIVIETVNFQNYLKIVLPNEWSPAYLNDGTPESLRTGAIAVRTFAIYRVNHPLSTWPFYHLTDSSQTYNPDNPLAFHENTNQAVADTAGIYVIYGGQAIRSEYRTDTGNPTFNSENDPVVGLPILNYLRSVPEPVTNGQSSGAGLSILGSRYWARGEDGDGDLFPNWDYCQILSHYYTGVQFDCTHIVQPTPADYRFNLLYLNGWDNRADSPVAWKSNSDVSVSFIVQNTGNNTWTLSDCSQGYDARSIALGGHWYKYNGTPAYGSEAKFEGSRIRLCRYRLNGQLITQVAPGETYPSQENGFNPAVGTVRVWGTENLAVGELYTLRWDMEFLPPHTQTWASRLTPGGNPNGEQWPTQDLRVRITSNTQNPPEDNDPPVVSVTPLPSVTTNSSFSDIQLSWSGSDTGASGLYFDLMYYVQTDGAEPPPIPLDPQYSMIADTDMTFGEMGLPEYQNALYTFSVRGHDGAGNLSDWDTTETRYLSVPKFRFSPERLGHLCIYGSTGRQNKTIRVENEGAGTLSWSAVSSSARVRLSQASGTAPSSVNLSISCPSTPGTYEYTLTFTGPGNTYHNPATLPVTIYAVSEIDRSYLPLVMK